MRAKLTDKQSIDQVMVELTLDEKLNLVGEYTSSHSLGIPDMDVPALFLADGATGVNGTQVVLDYMTSPGMDTERLQQRFYMDPDFGKILTMDLDEARVEYAGDADVLGLIEYMERVRSNGRQFVSFPSGVNIGALFSPETARKGGEIVGRELRDCGVDVCLGPNVDIARDPLGGRNYEMYGEDPKLVAEIAAAYIQGMQEMGVAACAKHFIANNQETNRNISDACVSERTLHELYARGFESAVKKGNVKSIMTAYSAVNGTFSSYNKELLTDLLRKEWGFDGIVVSDWGAVKDEKEKSLEAGMSMILCGPNDMSECKRAVLDGRLSEEVLNQRVREILNLVVELREKQAQVVADYDQDQLLQSAYEVIVDGSVLLKNEGGVLPLCKGGKVAFYGARSKELIECGTGSTNVSTNLHSNPWDESQKYCKVSRFEEMDGADVLVYTVAAPAGENVDRDIMDIEPDDRGRLPQVLRRAKERGLKTVVVLNVAGPVDMRKWIDYADAVLCIFIPGCMGGKAAADLLFGEAYPAGRLPVTFPLRYEDTPAYPNFPGEYVSCLYGEEIFVGYRGYDQKDLPVQYPFGHGLGYTTFECGIVGTPDACAEDKTSCHKLAVDLREQDEVRVAVSVKNVGERAGSEVIQIYGMEARPRNKRPVKELFGFQKVALEPGEEKMVEVVIEKDALRTFDAKRREWLIPIGEYHLYVGTSSRDIFAEATLLVKGKNPYPINGDSTMGEILKNSRAVEVINRFTGGMLDKIGEENRKFMVQMKLSDILSQGLISVIPDSAKVKEILNDLYRRLESLE